jgi:uncharacterized protein YkwD
VPRLLPLLIALAACGSLPGPVQEEPGAPAGEEPPPPRVDHYGGPADPAPLTAAERELARVAPGCRIDPRLVLAARTHARELAAGGGARSGADLDHLRFGVLAAGGTDYRIQPLVATADAAGRAALEAFALQRGAHWSHCGVGLEGGLLVWIGVERALELCAVPVAPPAGRAVRVAGRVIDARVRRVEAYLGMPGGEVRQLPVRGSEGFEIDLPAGAPGRHELELLADDGRGAEVAALLPLWVGVEPDRRPLVFQEPSDFGGRDPAGILYELIGEVRRRAALRPLRRDTALEELALAHSAEMAKEGFFGHVSPATGALRDRLAARGLRPAVSAENVARSRSVFRAHRNLVQSPSHRVHLIDPRFTHVGVGVAPDGDDVIVTEVFARW